MKMLAMAALALMAATGSAWAAGDATAGAEVFKKCATCHNIGAGATNKIGPALTGVVGRKPGTFPGFTYSQAMIDFGAKNPAWTPELLTAFVHAPRTEVPGTKMGFAGLPDQADVDNVVAYLQSVQ
ncbi:MAG TPA: cytochrome c family protein [Arsenicitalea sp.]|jgi:cytochrome c|nr:cytochrome c family protein [Arsenicitalea sp.]